MELIKNRRLYDEPFDPSKSRCKVYDIEFSSIDDDLIYFSGYFPDINKQFYPGSYFKFYMSTETAINPTGYQAVGRFILFDNEARVLIYNGVSISFLNLLTLKRELSVDATLEYPFVFKSIYSKKYSLFIGNSIHNLGGIKYDSQTNIEQSYTKEIIISPNPTDSFVNVSLSCLEANVSYKIADLAGVLLHQATLPNHTGDIRVDFSLYPAGIYFLSITCRDSVTTYKIIKEG
jgi:hypothetical protein